MAGWRAGTGRWFRRAGVLVIVVTVWLMGWAPDASAVPLKPPSFSLSSLVSWLTSGSWPVTSPAQGTGRWSGDTGQVPSSVTRAGGGQGNAPSTGAGQIPPYQPFRSGGAAVTTGLAPTGYVPGKSVLVPGQSSATVRVYRNPDGSTTVDEFAGTVNYQASPGDWQPIDATLAPATGGGWQERANSLRVAVASSASSPDLAGMGESGGASFSFGLAGAAPVAGSVSGSDATFAGALPSTDVVETATGTGLKEALVLHSAAAPSTFTFPLKLSGLTAVANADGSVSLDDAGGQVVVTIPAAVVADASRDPKSDLPLAQLTLPWQVVSYQGGQALSVSLPAGWLSDPSRVFPVTVDPSTMNWTATGTTYVQNATSGDLSGSVLLHMGTYDGGTDVARSLLQLSGWGTGTLKNQHITAASVNVWDAWAYYCGGAEPVDVKAINSSWSLTSVTWPAPTIGSLLGQWNGVAPSAACTNTSGNPSIGGWISVPLNSAGLSLLNSWDLGGTNNGLAVVADSETNSYQWKQLDGKGAGVNIPYLHLTYTPDVPPQVNAVYPPANSGAGSLTPDLIAAGYDPDAWPSPMTYQFVICGDPTLKTCTGGSTSGVVATSTPGGVNSTGTGWISASEWVVPAGALKWGQQYYWFVQNYDGLAFGSGSESQFTTNVPQPEVTSYSANGDAQGINPGSSSYTLSATDARVAGAGAALAIQRAYDSANFLRSGAFGQGWASVLDMKIGPGMADSAGNPVTEAISYPDGSQVAFGVNGTSYVPPQGRFATLTYQSSPAGFTLTDKNDTSYAFTQLLSGTGSAGTYGLTSITDALGNTQTFTWSGGHVARMTAGAYSPPGTPCTGCRALQVDWATPAGATVAHVSDVMPIINGTASTANEWTYAYNGDQLTGVCDPLSTTPCSGQTACPAGSGGCIGYAYTAGSDYQNALLTAGPASYWPFSETSGTTARSSVLANEGTDNGTYSSGVVLGQAGGLAGSTATSASFGTNSYVTLPQHLVMSGTHLTVGLWFKATAGNGGILFSTDHNSGDAASPSSGAMPVLYVGTDGKLYGHFWNGNVTGMVSTSAVNNGAWHFVALTGNGSTQTLYLDGQPVGPAETGQLNNIDPVNLVGDGVLNGNAWAATPTRSTNIWWHFTGNISDAAFWPRPLNAPEVAALYQSGTTQASLATQVTRPSGNIYSQVTWDRTRGAVTQVTDDKGGTWQLSPPSIAGSSQVFASAVLGAAPLDYWRLNEVPAAGTSPAVAANQINGNDAYYNAVSLGGAATREFADSPAAAFDGTSSYVQLPADQAIAPGTSASAGLWFSTSSAGTILLGMTANPIASGPVGTVAPMLWIGTDGKLRGAYPTTGGATTLISSAVVNDGKWHYALLSASGTGQSLYVDGSLAQTAAGTALTWSATPNVYLGAGISGTATPGLTASTVYYFKGSIADIALFGTALTAADDSTIYQASQASQGLTPVENITVTGPALSPGWPNGAPVRYQMDPLNGGRTLAVTDALGNTTQYGYDSGGFQYTVTDPNGNVTTTGHDVRGNVTSETTCQDTSQKLCSTAYYTYYPDDTSATLTPDPRNDLQRTARGYGSTSAADSTYLTTYTYNSSGELTALAGPAVAGLPGGQVTTYTYTTATTPAYDPSTGQQSGTTPAGLTATETSPGGAVTSYLYDAQGDIYKVTNPDGLVTTYNYDGLGRTTSRTVTSDTYPSGLTTTYGYDALGQLTTQTDPATTNSVTGAIHTARTTTTRDADGNILQQQVADLTGGDATRLVNNTFDSHDQLASTQDPAGNVTQYTYDSYGNKASQTDPDTNVTTYSHDPNGNLLTVTLTGYTGTASGPCQTVTGSLIESSRTYDKAGRLATITDAMCYTTAYTYYDNGLQSSVTRCTAWTGTACGGTTYSLESDTYNSANQLIQKVTNNGQTAIAYNVDAAGRTVSQTLDPAGLNRTATYSYSPDNTVLSTVMAAGTAAPAQAADYTYDPAGNRMSESVHNDSAAAAPSGWWPLTTPAGSSENYAPDASGHGNTALLSASGVTWAGNGAAVNGTAGAGIAAAGPVIDTSKSFSVSAWVNLASTSGSQGVVSVHSAQQDGLLLRLDGTTHDWAFVRGASDTANASWVGATSTIAGQAGTWTFLTGTFDAASGTMTLYVNGAASGTGTDSTPFQAAGPLAIGNQQLNGAITGQLNGSAANVAVYPYVLTASQVSGLYSGGPGQGLAAAPAGISRLTTSWALDQRGLTKSMTDPLGNVTSYSYDQADQLVQVVSPTRDVSVYGSAVVQAAPITLYGYDTFGSRTETRDPNGSQMVTGYDANGRPTSVTLPSYTRPDGGGTYSGAAATTNTTYWSTGEVKNVTDPLGHTTSYAYDQLGDLTQKTAADLGVTSYTYDANGDQLTVAPPVLAPISYTYDLLGRQLSASQNGATGYYSYGTGGTSPWLTSATSPAGVVTGYGYDAAGERTSVTDGAGNTTNYSYDAAGRPLRATAPDQSYSVTSYDEAGRATGQADYDPLGAQLRTSSAGYDANGNMISATDYRGSTSTFAYYPDGLLKAEAQPVSGSASINTSFGYDAAGNQTAYTDGMSNSWWTTYNSWGLPESQVEPNTATYTNAATQGTFTTSYDAAGRAVTLAQPAGVTVTDGYDNVNRLTSQSGSGAEAATTARSFGYDQAGQLTSASAPGGSDAFTYDGRGQLTSATGSSGSSSFSYNGDGQPLTITDAAGTTTYAYDTAGRLSTLADPVTGTTLSYGYNNLSQVTSVGYGTGGNTMSVAYDPLHRLQSQTLHTAGGATIASVAYGYDANSNLTSKATTGFGASVTNTYGYDQANRLTSWNNGTTTVNYGYDNNGNRTSVGSATYTYDARDQLTSDGQNSYSYTARGTLSAVSGPAAATYTNDAFGQAITQGAQTYGYDALGRLLTGSGGSRAYTFSYDGTSSTLASDGAFAYSWDPAGKLVGEGPAGGAQSAGVLAFTDSHSDVTGQFTATGAALSASAAYTPLGAVVAGGGLTGSLGYQSGWTDPGNGQVNMRARWYNPAAGVFTSRDTAAPGPVPNSAAANPFAYVAGNPMTFTDPTGHMLSPDGGYASTAAQVARTNYWLAHPPRPPAPASSGCHLSWDLWGMAVGCAHAAARVISKVAKRVLPPTVYDMAASTINFARHPSVASFQAMDSAYMKPVIAVASRVLPPSAVALIKTANHLAVSGISKASRWVGRHAAQIVSTAVGFVAFAGCEAVVTGGSMGTLSAPGVVLCGAISGAVSNAVGYGITAAQSGHFSWSGLGEAALSGAATGAAFGAAGVVAGKLLGMAAKAVAPSASRLFGAITSRFGSDGAGAADGAGSAVGDSGGLAGEKPMPQEPTPSNPAPDNGGPSCGGMSFAASTPVLTASGKEVAISKLRKGDKVIATDVKTGKTGPAAVSAVLIHHDTDLYTLRVQASGKQAVINTTSSHLFWDLTQHKWIKAGALKYGDHLRTPSGTFAVAAGGWTPRSHDGWMWDLTVPGPHDFYIQAATMDVLVHNCGGTFTARAGELANPDKVFFSHPVNDTQLYGGEAAGHGGVANLTNEDLITFGGPNGNDPITAYKTFSPEDLPGQPASDIHILAGHHRVFEIGNRVRAGLMDPETLIKIAIGLP